MFINLSGYLYSVVKSTAWQIRILSSMMMVLENENFAIRNNV